MMLWMLVQIAITIATSFWIAQEGEEKCILPSYNYWDLSRELLRSDELQRAVGVSSQQLAQIKAIRDAAGLDVILDKKMKELDLQNTSDTRIDVRELALAELDPIVKLKLEPALGGAQIETLREHAMKARFRSPFTPFGNPEVVGVCKISRADQKRLAPISERVLAKYEKERSALVSEFATNFYGFLPEHSKPLFVQYIGKCYLERYEVDKSLATNKIPFPPRFLTVHALYNLEIPKAQQQVGLSSSQIEKLSVIKGSLRDRLDDMAKKGGNSMSENYRMAEREMKSVLTPPQLVSICRIQARTEFEMEFAAPFKRAEFVKYLELSKEDVEALITLAVVENEDLKAKLNELDHGAFEVLCNALTDQSKERMQKLFKGFW